jgi:hypothetical protein
MRGTIVTVALWIGVCASIGVNVYLVRHVFAENIDRVQDRICVPLYDQTGLECCQ